jgi:hypothetical protein
MSDLPIWQLLDMVKELEKLGKERIHNARHPEPTVEDQLARYGVKIAPRPPVG